MNLDLHLLKNLLDRELKTCITSMLKTNQPTNPNQIKQKTPQNTDSIEIYFFMVCIC